MNPNDQTIDGRVWVPCTDDLHFGVDVPVPARHVREDIYHLLPDPDYDPEWLEVRKFEPGEFVRCRMKKSSIPDIPMIPCAYETVSLADAHKFEGSAAECRGSGSSEEG